MIQTSELLLGSMLSTYIVDTEKGGLGEPSLFTEALAYHSLKKQFFFLNVRLAHCVLNQLLSRMACQAVQLLNGVLVKRYPHKNTNLLVCL